MGAAVTAEPKSKNKTEVSAEHVEPVPSAFDLEALYGAPAGMPLFLSAGAGASVQRKCACGGSSSGDCEECRKREEEGSGLAGASVQRKCACGGSSSAECEECRAKREGEVQLKEKSGSQATYVHRAAGAGIGNANQPLPHLDRIQASFGHHDVTSARAAVGGRAERANARMGALAYTVGNTIAFSREPDVNLAAHEAAHVVQQRNGAKLPDGVGRPGDAYEQQADAAAEAVEHGDSAEAILDGGVSGNSSGGSAPALQHRLEVSAMRMFEPAIAGSEVIGEESEAPAKAPADGKKGGKPAKGEGEKGEKEEEAGGKKSAAPPKASASASGAQTPGSGPPSGTQPVPQPGGQPSGGEGAQPGAEAGSAPAAETPAAPASQAGASPEAAPAGSPPAAPSSAPEAAGSSAPAAAAPAPEAPGGAGAPAGPAGAGCAPACFHGLKEEPKEEEKTDKKPDDVPGGKSEAQAKEGDEPDAPEPDDCSKQQSDAGAPTAGQGGAPAAGPAAQAPAVPGAPQPAVAGGKGGGKASAAAGGGGAAGGGEGAPAPAGEMGGEAASPIEGSIGQSEGQRAAAVASYEASSTALDAISANSAELRSGIEFASPTTGGSEAVAQTSAASVRATQFFAAAADSLDELIGIASTDAPDQLGAQAEVGKAQILASAETQKNAVSARISAARDEARADAAVARGAVVQQANSFVAQVHGSSVAAIAALTASHAVTLAQVDALETTTLDQVNQIYSNGRAQMEGLGVTIGNECTAVGEQFANTYEGFAECTENGFWDGDLSQRRAQAQADASRKTGQKYRDEMLNKAKKRAREVVKNGRKQNRCQVITTASASRQKLDETLAQLIPTIEAARDQALEQAASTRATLLATIDSSLHATLRQLDQQEHQQRQTIDDTCYLQQVLQEQMAYSVAASLQGLVTSGASALHDSLFMLRSQFASSQAPDPKALDEVLTSVSHNVDAALASMQKGLTSGTAAALGQLSAALGSGVAALDKLVAANDETTSTVSSGFGSSMGAISGQDNFAPQRAGFTQMMQQTTTGGLDGFQKILGAMRDGCGKTTADSQKSLKQAAGDLEKNLRQSKQGLECQITKEADEAASHEAPAWKRLIAVLLIIIVIVIVIAVTVLTAGAGLGLLAVIALGAVVGAVTSGLIAIASNLWSNQPWHKGVVKAMVVGAITGAAGGALGMGIGSAVGKVLGGVLSKAAVEVAATVVSTAVIDVGSQFVEGGFSLKNFSWKQLGFDLAVALVLHKVGKMAEGAKLPAAAPEPVARPSEPAPVEPTPAETAPAAGPKPAEAPPVEPAGPKPAEAAPPEAAPSKPSPEAAPPEAAKPTPAEGAPKEATATEPSAPSERGVPEEAPPGEAPTTPEEQQVLDRTEAKSSEELTPEEIQTEREVASRTEGEPVEDPPFTTKKELPNGHEIEETPTGEECKRCSDGCAVFDKNGRRMGTVSAGPEGVVEHPVSTPEVEHAPPGRGPSAEPEFSASPEVPESVEGVPGGHEEPHEPAEISPSDPDVLNVPEEGEASTVGELTDEFSSRKPWEPPAGAEPKPPAEAPQDVRLQWIRERLEMHLQEAIKTYNTEGLTPNQEAALADNPGLEEAFRGSRIDQFVKDTIIQDPELAEMITAPDFVAEPDILHSNLPDWFDVTTPQQWAPHVTKYGPTHGPGGYLLPTR